MRERGTLVVISALLLSLATLLPAEADELEACRIKTSQGQTVSLGFPFRAERLKFLSKVKILVMPFKLKDNPNYLFVEDYKADYQKARDIISDLSSGMTNVEFVFAPTSSSDFSNSTMDDLKFSQQQAWQNDEAKSTYGFIRKFIADQDTSTNYTGFNAVIIEGSSTSSNSSIAEAMMFWQKPDNPWFRPIETSEGPINNVVLLDKHSQAQTIAHEVMHLYGLTDLYGTRTGPGRLSLMANNASNLLTYEKWVLGWYPDDDVKCLNNLSNSSFTTLTFDNMKVNQLAVVRAASGTNYIIETTKYRQGKYLAFYSIDNESRPPLKLFQEFVGNTGGEGVLLDSFSVIGTQLVAPEFTLLISDFSSTTISFTLVSSSVTSSVAYKDLLLKANVSKVAAQKAAADLKAKQEEEAKASLELKIKQEAESKAKQDSEAKAAQAAAKKKTSITCIKGKTTKKITAVKPKCPSGYKKK